jgi:hypothetical protein
MKNQFDLREGNIHDAHQMTFVYISLLVLVNLHKDLSSILSPNRDNEASRCF